VINMEKLVGGDELFFHPAVVEFYNNIMENFDSNDKTIALLLGCSKHKPYSNSFIHKKIIGMLKKYKIDNKIQQLIINEPLVVCPREWETIYPAAHYEYPPEIMGEKGRKIFIERLKDFFFKVENYYKVFVSFTPNHHKKIIIEASKNIIEPIFVPYNIYQLPKLRDTLIEVLKDEGIST